LALAFIANFGGVADQVASGTGLSRWSLLVQWANETATGTQIFNRNNLANIRCSPSTFCQYATLADFADAAIATWHNGFYGAVLATAGQSVSNQLLAIGASPWSAGHYGLRECGYAGCSLIALWRSEFDSVEDHPRPKLKRRALTIVSTQNSINLFVRGTDNSLFHNRFDGTTWSGWRSLGGVLATADIVAVRTLTGLDVFVVGTNNALFRIGSTDDGITWSPAGFENLGGDLSNGLLTAVGSPAQVSGLPVDLTPVEQQLSAVNGIVTKIEAAVVKAGTQLQQA
jgi:hypothetical protein